MSSHRPFTCSDCSQTFTRNENLERHKRSKHGGGIGKPFECPICHATFSRRDVCKRHAGRCRGGAGQRPASSEGRSDGRLVATPPTPPITSAGGNIASGSPMSGRAERPSQSPNGLWPVPAAPEFCSSNPTIPQDRSELCISAYFEYFHPSFPLLHRPTVDKGSPEVLKNIIVAIGSLYIAKTVSDDEATDFLRHGQALWDSGRKELLRLVDADWRELRRTWAMQSWLLHVIYGAFMGDAGRFNKAKKMLRSLVDAAQDLGLLRQSVATSASESWAKACGRTSETDDGTLHELWMVYVNEESMKIAMYTILFLDFQVFSPCNIRSSISPLELEWELPFSSSLWEAATPLLWLDRLNEEPRAVASLDPEGMFNVHYSSTRSLTLATQSLMSDSPNPHLVATLAASPITTLFVLTNINAFVWDFTRCYYQLPPTLPDPSVFHIFTQSQNKKIVVAVRHILRVVMEQSPTWDQPDRPLWTSIARLALAIKIALCRPDDLLISGIVDSSVVAGLATATHLTLGLYPGARRSLQSLMQHDSGDDAILVMLSEAFEVLSTVSGGDGQSGFHEPPWTTVATYRILLATWRSLRWAAAQIREKPPSLMRISGRFQSSALIFNAITDAVVPRESQASHMADWDGPGSQFVPPDVTESHFTAAILRFWKERSVWPIGASMATVLDEIISAGYS